MSVELKIRDLIRAELCAMLAVFINATILTSVTLVFGFDTIIELPALFTLCLLMGVYLTIFFIRTKAMWKKKKE